MQITSKFNNKISILVIAGLSLSYVLSLFFLQLFAAVIFLMWLFEKNSEKIKAVDTLTYIIITFGIIRLFSIIFSEYSASSSESFYKEALFYLSFFALSFYLKTYNDKDLANVVFFFVVGAAVNAYIGLIKFNLSIDERAQSFSSGYAAFSSYILAAFGLALFYRKNIVKNYNQYLWGIILSILSAAMITSLGRANIAFAIIVFLTAVVLKHIKLKIVLITVVLTIIISFISFENNDRASLQSRMENPTQLSDRDILFKGAKEIMFEHPLFGFGPRTFNHIFPFKDEFADKDIGGWHNDFLQIYFESGFLGLCAFIVLLFYFLFISLKNLRREKITEENKKVATGIFAATLLLIASGLTAGFIFSPVLSIVFVFLITTSSSIHHKNQIN